MQAEAAPDTPVPEMPLDEKLIRARGAYKGQLSLFRKFLDSWSDDSSNLDNLLQRLKSYEAAYSRYDETQTNIEIQCPEQSSDREEVDNLYFDGHARAVQIIRRINQAQKIEEITNSTPNFSPKPLVNPAQACFPKIELPHFDGNEDKWEAFFELFESLVNQNEFLPEIQKFHYLRSSLRGSASKLIETLSLTSDNYNIALDLLKERYDNPRLKIQRHMQALFNLPIVKADKLQTLRSLVDTVELHVRALATLHEPVQYWDTFLLHLISSKFDASTLRAWESEIVNQKVVTYHDMIQFLKKRCQILSSVNSQVNFGSSTSGTKSSQIKFNTKTFPKTQAFNTQVPNRTCCVCQDNHPLYFCSKFKALSVDDRRKTLQEHRRCFNCLSGNHLLSDCNSTRLCVHCGAKHHSLIHRPNVKKSTDSSSKANAHPESAQTFTQNAFSLRSSQVLLSTVVVKVQNSQGDWISARCLLDNAATHDFISESLIHRLGLEKIPTFIEVTGINNNLSNSTSFVRLCIKDSINGDFSLNLNCLSIGVIGSPTPSASFNTEDWAIPSHIKLADPCFFKSSPIDILLSANIFWKVLLSKKVFIVPGVFARQTKLGWILTGHLPKLMVPSKSQCNFVNAEPQFNLERFWDLENCTSEICSLTPEEQMCEQLFQQTTTRTPEGRFVVQLPRVANPPSLGDTKNRALKALFSVERKFKVDNSLKEQYSAFMEEYEALNHMEVVPKSEDLNFPVVQNLIYLNHHPVWKDESIREQIRVVFNGSAPDSNGISLNDTLLTGPSIQTDLFTVLLNFRLFAVAVIADIQKMYRQVLLDPAQRDLQRILWRDSTEKSIKVFRLKTITYGLKPSAFLAIRTLKHLSEIDGPLYNPRAKEAIRSCFYVDDFLGSFPSVEEAILTVQDLISLLKGGGFPLHKWCSNSKEFLSCLSSKDQVLNLVEFFKDETMIKALGLHWCPKTDSFVYKVTLSSKPPNTKRQILSEISKIYDPLQYLAPIIVVAKLVMQELWSLKTDWDELVPSDFLKRWINYRDSLLQISVISIPRILIESSSIKNLQLHLFADSSEKAYGCCAYICSSSPNDIVFSNLVCAKSKVAPLKTISLPRLELCAALLAVDLAHKLQETMKVPISKIFYWTDSTIVLSWIAKPASQWKIFVANRVSKIQEYSSVQQWHHVPSHDNPADIISRGCSPSYLANNVLYWHGPSWLTKPPYLWPSLTSAPTIELPEAKQVAKAHVISETNPLLHQFSTFHKLVRVMAYILRWKYLVVDQPLCPRPYLTASELSNATTKILLLTQQETFSEELRLLSKGLPLHRNSRLLPLSPYLDKDGLIRVGGRLSNANLEENKKHPIILPSKHHVTKLIIRQFHYQNLHVGTRTLLYLIREHYWPINGVHEINSVVRRCIPCFRAKPQLASQLMGDLPSFRMQPQRPFSLTGVDYAGPFLYQAKPPSSKPSALSKAYIVLFVCMITGAIHLELVTSASTSYFLAAFTRFFSRRGVPLEVFSDNSKTFLGASADLKLSLTSPRAKELLQNFAFLKGFKWNFIPPYGPHHGGRWEACVKLTKHHLKRVLRSIILSYEEFNSLIISIESIVNSRPLCPVSPDPRDLLPLSPSHFLIGDTAASIPSLPGRGRNVSLTTLWKKVESARNQFWHRWRLEYLGQIQTKTKWKIDKPNVKEGDLVLLKDPSPPLVWKLGRIIQCFPGRDNRVRVIKIRTTNGIFTRPITSVCLLPTDSCNQSL